MKISDPRKNIIVASIGVLLVALTLVSCEKRDDYYGRGDNGYSETIGFRVVDPMTQTRNYRGLAKVDNEAIDYKTVLRSDNSSDSLHLTTYVGDMNSQQYLMTRASAFTTTNLANFVVYGYNSKSEPFSFSDNFIVGTEAIKQTDGTWRFSPDVVWPSGKSDFFAVANIDNNTGVTISTADNATPSLTYVVPEFATQLNDQGTSFRYNHKDVVVARSGIQEANTGLVPLNFQHIFTAVQFKFGEIKKAGQIHSISIEGIHLNGSLDLAYESASGFMAMNAWSYNDNGTASFSLPLDNATISSSNNNASIGTLDNGFALMMIPQTLEGAKLIIEYTPEGSTTRVNMKANLIGTWAAGKVVTYTISISKILDIWFNNTTEICLDAHYVMNSALDIHIGEACTWKLTVPNDCDWLKFQTDSETGFSIADHELSGLQKDGWWIIEDVDDKATKTLTSNRVAESLKIVLVATENPGLENRSTTIILSSGDTSKPFKITQMCPHWIDVPGTETSPAKTIGVERIEEAPQEVPWGPYWYSKEKNYTVVYKLTSLGDAGTWFGATIWLNWANGDTEGDGVSVTQGGFLGNTFTFDYSVSVQNITTNTSYLDDGYSNTIGSWSTSLAAASALENFLGESKKTTNNFVSIDPINSAMLNTMKKNAFHKIEEDGEENVDIDGCISSGTMVWYLPAVNEAASGVYQENPDGHACETSFLNKNENGEVVGGKVYWTSTSVDAEHAYTYKYGSTTTDAPQPKDAPYHVRAIRRKTN